MIEEIGERIKNKKKSVLIVPDPVTYNFEQRLCHQLNIKGFIDVDVCSFNRLASSVLSYFGKNKKTYLDDCSKAMAIRIAVLENEDKLTVFKSVSHRKGFCERCLNMISIIENCGYTYDDIIAVSQKLDESILKYKLNDMAVIYKAYTEILDSGYTDNADKLKTAEELLKFYPDLKDTVVYIDGFDVFTSRLYSFFKELLKCTDVVIALNSDFANTDRGYDVHRKTLGDIINIAKECCCEYKIETVARTEKTKSDEIHFLEDNFYQQKPDVYKGECKNVSLCFYPNIREEIDEIAKKILTGVRNGNRYKDYAVICNDVKTYAPTIATIFKRYNIPVYTDKSHDITAHPVAMYLFSLLKCAIHGFTIENVSAIALSSLSPITADERDAFLSFINNMGVTPSEIENGLYFKRGSEEQQAEFDCLRKSFIEPLKIFKENVLKASTAKEIASVCYNFMEENGVYIKIQELTQKYEDLELFTLSDVTSQLWNKMLELLESLADLSGERKIPLSDFCDTLYEGFKSTQISTLPSVLDSVTFGDLTATKEQNIKYVYIVGANDGVIPAICTDERLVTRAESNILAELGMELAHTEETEDARTRYTIYSAICSPTHTLEFSCPLYSLGGASKNSSYIFKHLESLFPQIIKKTYQKSIAWDKLKEPFTKDQVMLEMARDKFVSPESQALLTYLKDDNNRKVQILKNQQNKREVSISPELASKLFNSKKTTSASELKSFAQCPFKHFIEYGIKPTEGKEYVIDSLDLGILFHDTFEKFLKEASDKTLTKDDCYKKAGEIFDKNLPNVHFGAMLATERQKAFNGFLKNIACETAWKINKHVNDCEVIGTEIHFGSKKYPPIEIDTEFGTIYLEGKIDRADRIIKDSNFYLRIIDYKSGKEKFSESGVEKGTDLQLLLYMSALLKHFNDHTPAAAQYMNILDNSFSGTELIDFNEKGVTREHFNALLDKASETSTKLAGDMLGGNIEAETSDYKHVFNCYNCKNCKYISVCGIKRKVENYYADMD